MKPYPTPVLSRQQQVIRNSGRPVVSSRAGRALTKTARRFWLKHHTHLVSVGAGHQPIRFLNPGSDFPETEDRSRVYLRKVQPSRAKFWWE